MGTSSSFKGQSGKSPLIPSWLNPEQEPTESPPEEFLPDGEPFERPENEQEPEEDQSSPKDIQIEPDPNRFQSSRTGFSSYIKSGASNPQKLNKALGRYVSRGTKGAQNATQRMGKAAKSTTTLAGIFRNFVNQGINTTLTQLNCSHLIGKSFHDILTGLFGFICPVSGNIPDAIIGQAYGSTILKVSEMNLDINPLKVDDLKNVISILISETILARIINDIGLKIINYASEEQLKTNFEDVSVIIEGIVTEQVEKKLDLNSNISEAETTKIINDVYKASFEFMEDNGDE